MNSNVKKGVWIAVMSLGIGFAGGTAIIAASPSQEQHDRDYSKNKNYQQGMRDGRDDFTHNRDHSKKRHFKRDDDRKDYEAGYQGSHHK